MYRTQKLHHMLSLYQLHLQIYSHIAHVVHTKARVDIVGVLKNLERQSSQCNGSLAYKLITVKGTPNTTPIRHKGAVRPRCLKWYHCLALKKRPFLGLRDTLNIFVTV